MKDKLDKYIKQLETKLQHLQSDIKETYTGLHYVMELAKAIPEIKWHKLKSNHRSELISKILDFEHKK